ncbi:glycosyltransferase family 61 protein [Nocardioides nanhaiensis]|uniref:Glycosyltransferase 61 catalytic domain-containing protein n=1 Tax=Nocardioides nanhaiensis TaxID=1476871 RepID=A0ABP8VUQ6_9ACTN
MTRLPPRLQPLWPAVKVAHRAGARGVGTVTRRIRPDDVPTAATPSSRETALLEPGSARYHLATRPVRLQRPAPVGRPVGHPWFASLGPHEVPETFVLELRDGSVLGPHCAVVTAGNRMDHETSHYFGTRGWREHPVYLDPLPRRAAEREQVSGTLVTLASRATGHNYYHFLIDALPRLGILEDALPGALRGADAVLVDRATRYQRELVAMLGLDRLRVLEPRRRLAVRADRLLVPSLPNSSTVVAPETTRWLREALPPSRTTGLPERLYVTRGTTPHTRRVVREEELRERLERRGFAVVDPGRLSVQEQIDHFAAARVVVAPHGAALTNLVFSRPGVRLLELFAPTYLNPGYWSIVANIADSRYRYLVASEPHSPRATARQLGVMDDIDLDPAEVEDALDELLSDQEAA